MRHDAALAHIDGLIQYIEEEHYVTLCNKMLLKKQFFFVNFQPISSYFGLSAELVYPGLLRHSIRG